MARGSHLSALLDGHPAALPVGHLPALLVRDLAAVGLGHVTAVVHRDGLEEGGVRAVVVEPVDIEHATDPGHPANGDSDGRTDWKQWQKLNFCIVWHCHIWPYIWPYMAVPYYTEI